ncbi:dystroglycan-like [Dorcoceras hygrometricum]|uniref:Dystroglycan-like n=1 Tax=Dorcoceras hygrometricum TaxID=472368 RepID=A0A2Z7C7V9_9LAMI|nr:dystroglycan-like [Dorcoceras hygrometricum]
MKNIFAYGEQRCLRQRYNCITNHDETALITSFHLIVFKGNRSAYVSIADRGLHSLHSQMASAFITYSYQINFESVLMIHDQEGMLNMFNALEASGLRKFLGCESILYEKELGDFFDTTLIQGEDITGVISGKFVTISPTLFSTVFDLPTEGITNFSEVPKDKVYDARSLFSQKGLQIDVHDKKKFMKHEFRLLNDILAKAITVKAGSFDSVTVERFQMMTEIQYGLKVNWGKVLFDVLKDMVDRTQKKAKGFAAQIGVLLKSFPDIPMGDGVPFPSAKVLSMRTVHTYIDLALDQSKKKGVEEVDLVSSDVSTVYRSPSPPSPGVDSLEHDLRFALGPAIFSRVEQEERLYFVQSPDSPPAVSPHHESSSSSTDVSLHFDSTDVPVHAQAATHAPASVDFTKLAETLEDLQSSLAQRIHDSNCEMLSKLNSVELGVRGDLLKMQSLLRQSFETACRFLERQSNTHTAQFTDLKKGLMGPVGTIFGDLFDIKKKQREQDARLLTMDEQIAAIRNEHLEFQSKIAADMLSLSTQVGDIADFLRSGVAKKGEMGSSSRTTTVRAQTQSLPPTTGTFEERVAQARRNIIETEQVISIEEAAARVIENDRRESERLERERRDRRQSRSGTYKRRR